MAHINPSVLQAVLGRGYTRCLEGCFQGYRAGLCRIVEMNFRDFFKGEVPRTPQSGSWGTTSRGTITPPIDQEEEVKDRGFLEEALARPGG